MDTELNDGLQDPQQPDATGDAKPEPTLEDYRELERKAAELEHKNAQLYARVKKAKLEPATEKTVNQPTPAADTSISERLDRIDLKTEGYSEEEVDFLMKVGGKKALEDKRVKAGIEAMRQQAKAEAATVDTDSAKSDIERKFTKDQLASMSASEMEKLLPRA